jgi:serine/threonine-protein kinase
MDALQPVLIAGTEEARNPFLSPDGRWVAFMTDQKLKKVPLQGGTPIVLADAFQGSGTWGDDGTIVYKPANPSFGGGLWRLPASGGTPTALTTPDSSKGEQGHYWPQMLPGSQAVLFTAFSTATRSRIDLLSLASRERKTLVEDGYFGRYVPTGHLLFVRAGALLAVPFDLGRGEITGEPVPLLEDVAVFAGGRAGYAVSGNGVLAYFPASQLTRQLVWVDRAGREEPVLDSPAEYYTPRISPDGSRIALAIGPKLDIWIYEIGRRVLLRLTRRVEGNAMAPVWSADGERVIYSGQSPVYDLFWRAADGSTPEEKLVTSPEDKWATGVSPDGKTVAFGAGDLEILRLGAQPATQALTRTPYVEGVASWSPDGRWLAYSSNESGRFEVYVGPAPNPTAARRQVSTAGGMYPRWGTAGREIVYFGDFIKGRLLSAPFDPGTGTVGTPKLLFQGPYEPGMYGAQGYDVTPDGRRFVMVKYNTRAQEVYVTLNWPQELERRDRP